MRVLRKHKLPLEKVLYPLVLAAFLFGIFATTGHVDAAYGRDGYGSCTYTQDCPPPAEPPVPVTPPPAPAPPVVKVDINLEEGAEITKKDVPLVVTFYTQDGDTKTPIPTEDIGWVAYYVDDVLIDTVYSPQKDGSFKLNWQPDEAGERKITAVVYDKEGKPLGRQDITVTVAVSAVTIPDEEDEAPTGTGSTEEKPKSGGGIIGTITNTVQAAPEAVTEYIASTFENVAAPQSLKEVPYFVAQTFPVWIFIILTIIALRLAWQAVRETLMLYRIEKAIALEKKLADQKIAFVMVISHYLNTPLTLIRNGTEVLAGITPEARHAVQLAVDDMKVRVDKVLSDTTASQELAMIEPPKEFEKKFSPLRSPSFWVPVAVVVLIMVFANGLLMMFNKTDIVVGDNWFRIALLIMGITFVALSVRSRHIRQQERNFAAQRLTYEQNLDRVRSDFIVKASTSLRSGIKVLETAQKQLKDAKGTKFFDEGLAQIDRTVYKLELSLRLRADTIAAKNLPTVPLYQAFAQALESHQTLIAEHGLRVENHVAKLTVHGEPEFITFMTDSLVDNAVKFSKDNGSITITENKKGVIVQDTGVGINQQALATLFEPFSRGTSTTEFTYEGLGFSLYLTKLIVERMGGTIEIDSTEGSGTKVTVNFS